MAARKSVGGEDLEVAVDLGVEAGAVDDHVGGGFEGHLFHREGVAQDVLGEAFEVGFVFRGHRVGGVDVEAAVLPGVEDLDALRRQQLLLDQEVDDFGAEEFFQGFERGFWEGEEVEG